MKKLIVLVIAAASMLGAACAESNSSLPAGTSIKVKLETTLATFSNKSGDAFSGRVTEPVMMDGKTVIPIGTTVQGRVTRATEPRRIAGKPTIGILPESMVLPNGEKFVLNAVLVDTNMRKGTDVNNEGEFKGAGKDNRDLAEIGIGTASGMTVGSLIGGGKGLVIGGLVGATATVTHWLSQRRSAILPAGTELTMELSRQTSMTPAGTGGN